ncbi:hypothetical protein MTQ10_05170 [Streptomyces sp. XM83C]|jgi:hypothetical protein|uniref:Secreted protein n=1 Tax=Streptomyces thermocoprophilus TaxID=78356 RepID=A0ABV5VBE1_9ACTN|nr:hypothetical protein [Streptomyces sp. XM83C]MCK1819013.1 hypothetical protein [Streptomyces sp. XM83C]
MRRRTARVLSVALLSGAAVAAAAPQGVADPAAEVGPASVQPGGTVTVTVTCDGLDGGAPDTLEATSDAFEEETVPLRKVSDGDSATGTASGTADGTAYRGTARIAPADEFDDLEGTGPDTAWTVDGTCPAGAGGSGKPWSATFDVARTSPQHGGTAPPGPVPPPLPVTPPPVPVPPHSPCPSPHGTSCGAAALPHGVRAGEGGTFTPSVPALVAGGLLIAGAAGAAVHRLRQRDDTPHR